MSELSESIEQEIIRELKGEFIEDTLDRLETLDEALDGVALGRVADGEVISIIRREAHSIKGMGGSFGFPIISNIAHRLEDYLAGVKVMDDTVQANVLLFIEVMREVVEDGENPDDMISDIVLKRLPAQWVPTTSPKGAPAGRQWEVLLGLESAVLRSVIGRSLADHGCRALTAASPFEIIQMAATMKPDAIIMTTVMDGLWGADVARALGVMGVTSEIPVALLTTLDDAKIGVLPARTILIHEDKAALQKGLATLCERMAARDRGEVHYMADTNKKAAG